MTASVAFSGHRALSLFSVHAPQDAALHQHLEKHLSPLKRLGLISTHSVDDIPAGADRDGTITQFLRQAQIILLLISSDFIASDSCYSLMTRALQREKSGSIRVIPILLRPIEWEQLPGSQLSALPSNGRPVINWPTSDDAFDDIARSIRQVVQMLNHTTDERTITQTHLGYLHWLIKRTSFLDTRGISSSQRPLRVKLETASIILNARYEDPQTERPFLPPLTLPAEVSAQASTPEPLSQVVSRHDHLVILGEPGSGKTTLLHSLALHHAQALRDHSKTDMGEARFPILLRIADYVQYGMHQNKTVSEYLADDCTRHECSAPHLDDILRAELQAGRCLLLFDGLDEVIHAEDRQMVVQRLEDFVRSYDEVPNRFLLTSRSAGYHENPLSDVFAHYTLQGLEETEIRCLLEAWYVARTMALAQDEEASSTQLQRARREADDLLNAIQAIPGVRRLASNPLLLRMLAQLHYAGAPLPQQRAELYDQMTKTLTQTWRAVQGVSLSALSLFDHASTTRLLSRLAYWFHSKLSGRSAHEQDVCEEMGKEWASLTHKPWYTEDPESEKQMKQFLCMVRDHTGIMVEDTPHHYRFAHLTFEEYYAARYLVANSQEQAKRIRTHLHDWRWQEPILLALGLVGMKSREQACLLLETAILAQGEDARTMGIDPSLYESLLGRDYLFALRCLGNEIPIRPALAEQLITRLLQEITQQTGSGTFQKYQEALAEHLRFIEESTSASVLLPHLIKNLKSADLSLRLWSLYSLGRIGRTSLSAEVRHILFETLHDHDSRIRSAALWGLSHMQETEITGVLLNVIRNEANASVRRDAVKYLGERGQTSSQVTKALLNVLREAGGPGDFLLREAAAKSLGQLGDASPEVIIALIALLPRSMPLFADQSVLQSLRQLSRFSSEVVPMIADALRGAASYVRVAVARALETFDHTSPEIIAALSTIASHGFPDKTFQTPFCAKQWSWFPGDVETLLLLRLRDSHSWVRWEAIKALGQFEEISDQADHALLDALSDEDALVRAQAVVSLHAFEMSSEVLGAYITVLSQDTAANVRACIIECLGEEEPSEEIVQALLGATHDTEDHIRACAVESLGKMVLASPEILETLLSMLSNDGFFGVRWEIVKALKKLKELPERAISATVQALLEDTHWAVRQDCARILGQSASHEEHIIPALLKGVTDRDMQVRQACSQALVRLGHRFPERREMIMMQLECIIQECQNDTSSQFGQSIPWNDGYSALWHLIKDDPFEGE